MSRVNLYKYLGEIFTNYFYQRGFMDIPEHKNTRSEELEFIVAIMTDLVHNYNDTHNDKLLEELISNLKYRIDREEITITAKSKSEEYLQQQYRLV